MKFNTASLEGQKQGIKQWSDSMHSKEGLAANSTDGQRAAAEKFMADHPGYTPYLTNPNNITHAIDPQGNVTQLDQPIKVGADSTGTQSRPDKARDFTIGEGQNATTRKFDLTTDAGQKDARMQYFNDFKANRGQYSAREQRADVDRILDQEKKIPMVTGNAKITHMMDPETGAIESVGRDRQARNGWTARQSYFT
jgi:hypothetical protein